MKIAVIGGNLLGCATVLNLALVEENDHQQGHSDVKFSVTLFEQTDRLGGNSFKSHVVDGDLHVEVGTYRTISPISGTHLNDLILAANGQSGKIPILSRYLGSTVSRHKGGRQRANEIRTKSAWTSGTCGRVVRTFGIYDSQGDEYWMGHGGFPILNLVHRILNHSIWRSVAFGLTLSAYKALGRTRGHWQRALAVVNVLLFLFVFVQSPRVVVASWQRQLAFWYTTLGMMVTFGITAPIIRGSVLGVIRMLKEANESNVGTVCTTTETLMSRLGLKEHVRSTGREFINMFKLNKEFARKLVEPYVRLSNNGRGLDEISSLGVHLALIDGDHVNSDAESRLRTVVPNNASLCDVLIARAKDRMSTDVRLRSAVTRIQFDETVDKYTVTVADGSTEAFDGIVLAASGCSSQSNELEIISENGSDLSDMLRCARFSNEGDDEEEEVPGRVERSESSNADDPWSHIAIVKGNVWAGYFRYSCESEVPDCVLVTNSATVSMIERVRETTAERMGVYVVRCSSDFKENEGTFEEMFVEGSEIVHFERVASVSYDTRAFREGESVDEVGPSMILGRRFVYAAAIERMGKHAELDAISAGNAASLFSKKVRWSVEPNEVEYEDGNVATNDGDKNKDECNNKVRDRYVEDGEKTGL